MVPCAEKVRFGKNGSDATSGAVRVARAFTGRDFIACSGYHGWQDWYIGSTTRNKGVPSAVSDLTHAVPYGELDAVDAVITDHAAPEGVVQIEHPMANMGKCVFHRDADAIRCGETIQWPRLKT